MKGSEGQAYAILFSVFTEDRDTFDFIYDWTEKHLSRKNKEGDHFLAWHWEGSGVSDWMPASDADCEYAFALLLALYRRMEDKCAAKAIQIINDILDKETVRMSDNHPFLLPGLWGNEKDACLTQNPSYYNPAAFHLFYYAMQDSRLLDLIETGYWSINQTCAHLDNMKGRGLVSDWCIVDVHGGISAAENRSGNYGWESVRIPMRMGLDACWFGTKEGLVVLNNIYQILNTLNAGSGETKAVYRY